MPSPEPPSWTRCPACGYDLRGLPPGRVCPECGTQTAFYGPRRISGRLAERITRRLLWPPLTVLFVLSLWGTDLETQKLLPGAVWGAGESGGIGLLGAFVLAVFLRLDFLRYRRLRRRRDGRTLAGAGGLGPYLRLQGIVLALVVCGSLALLLGLVPAPGPAGQLPYFAVLLVLLLLEAGAVGFAAMGVPALLGRRGRRPFDAALTAVGFVALATFTAGGCCVFSGPVRELSRTHPLLFFLLLPAAYWSRDLFVRLRRQLGLVAPPTPKPPVRKRRRRVLVRHPGEVDDD